MVLQSPVWRHLGRACPGRVASRQAQRTRVARGLHRQHGKGCIVLARCSLTPGRDAQNGSAEAYSLQIFGIDWPSLSSAPASLWSDSKESECSEAALQLQTERNGNECRGSPSADVPDHVGLQLDGYSRRLSMSDGTVYWQIRRTLGTV
eukprot:1505496-Amphidinium_carterae.2